MSASGSRRGLAALCTVVLLPLTAACAVNVDASTPPLAAQPTRTPTSAVRITTNLPAVVKVDKVVRVSAARGTLDSVVLTDSKGTPVPGRLNAEKTGWVSTQRLEAGASYELKASGIDSDGLRASFTRSFQAERLTLAQQTYPSLYPLNKQTVGVGMPIMVHFDVPVTNRKLFTEHMHVTSSAGQKGAWYWLDSQNAHYRPRSYWKPYSTINVDLDLNSLPAGNGVYGQLSKTESFQISRSNVINVNIATDHLTVVRDGKVINTIPVTTGQQPDFTTRSGTKVIMEKLPKTNMDSETIGIAHNNGGYDLKNVQWAMRLTNSGEFLHAAPWSVASQGVANVSHGCTGMSTSNALWLFDHSMIGDPVVYTGSSRPMTLTNGYGDWNLGWSTWSAGGDL